MNNIIKIAQSEETSTLCPRCLGRLFGKLGHYLDNPTRGKVLRLVLHLYDQLHAIKEKDAKNYELLSELIEAFSFEEQQMCTLTNVLGIAYPITSEDIKSSTSKIDTEKTNSLITQIRALSKEEVIDELKLEQPSCELCDETFIELPKFAELVQESLHDYEFNDFLIGSKIDNSIVTAEEELWSKLGTTHPEPIKTEFNRELGKLVGPRIDKTVNFDTPDITVLIDTRYDNITLQIASLFIYGRYRKLARDIPQTKWPCKRCWGKGCDNCNGTGKLYQTSVEELVAEEFMGLTKGKAHAFHGMGREDIGVRMLGSGRPFILEITEPVTRNLNLEDLEKKINISNKEKVEVSGLRISNHREVREIKAAKPSKTYNVKVNFENSVNKGKLKEIVSTLCGATVKQRTPVRVSHRRADLVREREVLELVLKELSNNGTTAELEITGESGIYIKELIHGDSGRTIPSLAGELKMECTVMELDVLRINDE
jgi:tRNA pseudouridine synthase 10